MENLIERAESEWLEAEQLQQAIIQLSTNAVATEILTTALRDAAIRCETLWQEIEQRDDFKTKYGNDRAKARADFIHKNCRWLAQ